MRFINAYAEGLGFKVLSFARCTPKATGRPPYHPADLLKLYLYGHLHRIRSKPQAGGRGGAQPRGVWQLHTLRPGFKTIAVSAVTTARR